MSNRGRQNVASFLVNDLGLDWRLGAEWFEAQLLDYDPTSNYGNWQYVAGVGADPRQNRYFNIVKQARTYDPECRFMRHWLPELAAVPPIQLFNGRRRNGGGGGGGGGGMFGDDDSVWGDDYPSEVVAPLRPFNGGNGGGKGGGGRSKRGDRQKHNTTKGNGDARQHRPNRRRGRRGGGNVLKNDERWASAR